MKYIRFIMTNKQDFVLPEDQAKKVIESDQQLIMIHNKKGEWTGDTINKAYLVCTEYDIKYTNLKNYEKNQYKLINQNNEQKKLS